MRDEQQQPLNPSQSPVPDPTSKLSESGDEDNDNYDIENDIINAIDLLEFTKVEFDVLREDAGWGEFLKVTSFCENHKVKVV